MSGSKVTLEQSWKSARPAGAGPPIPGIVVIHSAGKAVLGARALAREEDGTRALEIGRAMLGEMAPDDSCVSRRHARIVLDGDSWSVTDLGSRNGTAVDGHLLREGWTGKAPRVVRTGDTIMLPLADVRRFVNARVEVSDGVVIGPTLAEVRDEVRQAARSGETLFITGESGAGKEVIARAFHGYGPSARGPFVAVNCASIPENIAERLLFGARRGAYSGAEDAEGFLQTAHNGTLFLDEIAELSAAVQAKLLRVLETREVLALGASRPQRVDVRVCAATHRELRAEVTSGRFRLDLFYRVGTPAVALPPLRERLEEIPWLAEQAAAPMAPHVSLVEELLLRPWPGNVRELLVEVKAATRRAQAAGSSSVAAEHLAVSAGASLPVAVAATTSSPGLPAAAEAPVADAERERIEAALRREGGNVTRAAKALGMHRNQLRRWVAKNGPG